MPRRMLLLRALWPDCPSASPHQIVHAVFPHTAFRCSSPQGMRSRPARCSWHLIQPVLRVKHPVAEPDKAGSPVLDLVPLTKVSPQRLRPTGSDPRGRANLANLRTNLRRPNYGVGTR
jgi:hypothetical protein